MSLIRLLSENFDPVYVRPRVLARAARELLPLEPSRDLRGAARPTLERRSGQRRGAERRRHQHPVLLDLRSSHSRRTCAGRRGSDRMHAPRSGGDYGIDTYA